MKDGYETQCGQRGLQLSGAHIAIAKAILKNPKILLSVSTVVDHITLLVSFIAAGLLLNTVRNDTVLQVFNL